jgi:tRNA nucleotidyltransferase (CCA-adding enzyme)
MTTEKQELHDLLTRLTTGDTPHLELKAARGDGSLARLLPEVDALYGVPQTEEHHPEVDTGIHTELVLEVAAGLTSRPRVRFLALTHDLGKGVTPREEWPRHLMHEKEGVPLVAALCERAGLPEDWKRLGELTSMWHLLAHRAFVSRPRTFVNFFVDTDFINEPAMFNDFLLACEADKRGRGGMLDTGYEQRELMLEAMKVVKASVPLSGVLSEEQRLYEARCRDLKTFLRQHPLVRDGDSPGMC